MITMNQLIKFAPLSVNRGVLLNSLNANMQRCGIVGQNRVALFMSQISHESGGFSRLYENLNYSAERLCQVWKNRFPTIESAQPYARNPQKLANKVYANRLGNGDEASGDGWKYRGRGLIQLTGKDNYIAASKWTGINLVDNPDYASDIEIAVKIACDFWRIKGLNSFADSQNILAATKVINGGTNGLKERVNLFSTAKVIFKDV